MKKITFLLTILSFISCSNEIEDTLSNYKNKPKSPELMGFWQLKGVYPVDTSVDNSDIGISQGIVGLEANDILYLDAVYLKFLNKSTDDDSYFYNKSEQHYWFNENQFIKSVLESKFNTKYDQIINEYQIPYKLVPTKDTLVVQNQGKKMYLVKTDNVKVIEYPY